MNQNDNILNLMKNTTQNSLSCYNKVIPETSLTLEQLIEKVSEIDKKITSNKSNLSDVGTDIRFSEKVAALNQPKNGNTQYIDFDAFRKDNPYIPRLMLNRQRVKKVKKKKNEKEEIKEKFRGLMSYYEFKNLSFNLTRNKNEKEMEMKGGEKSEQKNDQGRERRNLKNYDKSLDPFFFTNRYIEYIYNDKGEDKYEESGIIRYLFEKNPNKTKIDDLYISNPSSPCLQTCIKLVELEKQELEEENKEYIKNTTNEQENPILTIEDIKKLRAQAIIKKPDDQGPWRKTIEDASKLRGDIIKSSNKKGKTTAVKEEKKDKKLPIFGRTSDDVSFRIDVIGEITKKIRGNPQKNHPRGMVIKGPIAKWFRINQEKQFEKEKGHFDIRDITFSQSVNKKKKPKGDGCSCFGGGDDTIEEKRGPSGLKTNNFDEFKKNPTGDYGEKGNFDDDYQEEFEVSKIIENGKLNNKPATFSSHRIVEFKNKTFKHFFQQLQNYFNEFYSNIENSNYSILKFLSDTECTSLDIPFDINTSLITYIYWHPNLVSLSIKTSQIKNLAECIKSSNWECRLETLTISKGSSSSDLENSLDDIFSQPNSISIQNIHFIDVMFTEGVKKAMIRHIDTFYSIPENEKPHELYLKKDEDEINYFKIMRFCDYKNNTIPILNLSIKRSATMSESNKSSDEILDMKLVYSVFIYMLYKALENNRGTVPEVFNLLNLSEQTVKNEKYLVKIITTFKLIKELDISNTKVETSGKLIESSSFLSNIKLTNKVDEVYDDYSKEDSYLKYKREYDKLSIEDTPTDLSFDFSMGVYPILETIYLYNTELKEDIAKELYSLFKKLKFFRAFYYSSPAAQSLQDGNINLNMKAFERLLEEMHKDRKTYCENVFMITNEDQDNLNFN